MLEIIKEGDWTLPQAVILDQAFELAKQHNTKLSSYTMNMQGMSGRKYRTLINRLVEKTPDARYLEVGSWKGSTVCSAMDGNTGVFKCIDNWYEGSHIKVDFETNTKQLLTDNTDFSFIYNDFRNVDYHALGKFNIYMFDGPHEKQDQYDGIYYALPALDDCYTLIVDDYNVEPVQSGTRDALVACGQTVIASISILSGEDPYLNGSDWHNGYFIAVIKKG